MEFGPTQVSLDYRALFDLHPRALDLADQLGQAVHDKQISDVQTAFFTVLTAAVRSIAPIPYVCNAGHALEASPFVRGLFEKMVWLDYLRTDPERLAFLLTRNFELARIVSNFDRADETSWAYESDMPNPERFRKQAKQAAEQSKEEYSRRFPAATGEEEFPTGVEKLRSKLKKSWAFISFKDMVLRVIASCDDEGFKRALKRDFAGQYTFDCQMTHSVGFYQRYIVRPDAGRIEFHPEPTGDWAPWVLLSSLKYFSRIMILCAWSIESDLPSGLKHAIIGFQDEIQTELRSNGILRSAP